MSEWISVDERLPLPSEPVLISDGENIAHARYTENIVSGGFWRVVASNDYVSDERVTHWMPLPDPPKTLTNEVVKG